jgi:hypothetical protein
MWKRVDLRDLRLLVGASGVVRQIVVALVGADLRVRPVAAVVGHDEGRHAGLVGLKGQGQQVEHHPHVLLEALRNTRRLPLVVGDGVGKPPRVVDALLDLADGGQVLVQLLLVLAAQAGLQGLRVGLHEVEHALAQRLALLPPRTPVQGVAAAEQPLKDRARIDLGRIGRGG